MIEYIVEALAGLAVTGAFSWAAVETRRGKRSTHAKLDQIDLILRGDGNGTVGIAERVRAVQADLTGLRSEFTTHAGGEEDRIIRVVNRLA